MPYMPLWYSKKLKEISEIKQKKRINKKYKTRTKGSIDDQQEDVGQSSWKDTSSSLGEYPLYVWRIQLMSPIEKFTGEIKNIFTPDIWHMEASKVKILNISVNPLRLGGLESYSRHNWFVPFYAKCVILQLYESI